MKKFKHTVTLKEIPKHIFDKEYPSATIAMWIMENIGKGNLLNITDGIWSYDPLEYTEDGQNIILRYRFKNPSDATMFSLRWA